MTVLYYERGNTFTVWKNIYLIRNVSYSKEFSYKLWRKTESRNVRIVSCNIIDSVGNLFLRRLTGNSYQYSMWFTKGKVRTQYQLARSFHGTLDLISCSYGDYDVWENDQAASRTRTWVSILPAFDAADELLQKYRRDQLARERVWFL